MHLAMRLLRGQCLDSSRDKRGLLFSSGTSEFGRSLESKDSTSEIPKKKHSQIWWNDRGSVLSDRVMTPLEVARLIDSHAATLVLCARQWCAEPEDVVQEAFVKLARQSQPLNDAVAWLYRVVRNGAINSSKMARRRQRRESAVARPDRWFVEPEVDGLDAETAVAALSRLNAEQREVIVARHWGGLSFEQIAAMADCSTSTAFRRYTAGVEELRKQLGVICPNRSSNA
jgi:RNA polymerase sigma factor (sigma-70 family)